MYDVELVKKTFVGNSGNINSNKLKKSFLDKNQDIVNLVNKIIENTEIDFKIKVSMIIYNNGDCCSVCKNAKIDKIGKRIKYTCEPCVKKISKEKQRETNIQKYGFSNPMQNEDIKNKTKETNLSRYGSYSPLKNKNIMEKRIETNVQKYGFSNPMQNEDIKNKTKETNLSRYGNETTFNSELIRDKSKKSMITRYGNENYSKTKYKIGMSDELHKIYLSPEEVYKVYVEECYSSLSILGEYFNTSPGPQTMWAYFKRNGLEVISNNGISKNEKQILEIIKSKISNIEYQENDRTIIKPYELDMYFPEYNIAIEYCGAYWHSEIFKDNTYHHIKYEMCRKLGINLITIWDYEYENRKKQVLDFVLSKFGIFSERKYARNMIFKESFSKQKDFFETYHIQGSASIDRNFCLYDGSELLGCVSYSKHHRDASKYSLNRLVFKSGVQVVGGVSKLLKNSLSMINNDVVTWSDNRYSNGLIYEKNGFIFDGDVKPDYCYYDTISKKILSKQSNSKSKIGCPDEITEKEFCNNMGRYRLWDCGKIRWKKPLV